MNRLEKVGLAKIDLNDTTFMSRLDFNEGNIKSLAEDILRFGQRNPIGLREKEGGLQVIYGWNRIKAIQLLCWNEIEARDYGEISDLEAQMHNIQDNLKHQNLTTLEIAYQVKKLKETYGLHVEKIAEIYGIKKSSIYNLLSLTEMEDDIKNAVHLGEIDLTHALKISLFPVSNRLEILRRTIDEELSVSKLEKILRGESESVEEVMTQRELYRLRKFLFTQVDSEENFLEGVTRESIVDRYVSILEDYHKEKNESLLTLMENINDFMYSIIYKRLFASLEKPYDMKNVALYEWLAERGFRCDYPPSKVSLWFLYEYTRYQARYCNHRWVNGSCEHCGIDKLRVDEVASRRWEDPPYEEPPTPKQQSGTVNGEGSAYAEPELVLNHTKEAED